MYQQKKQWCVLHAKLFKLFVGGALLLAVSPAYAAGDNYSGTGSTHSSLIVHQNGRTITGTVIDETGETVIGANVVVKGTTNGSITDVDGRFSLNNVPDGAILIVSYVGYEDLSVKVGVQSQLTIKLKESSELIDEVVVVGYASQKKVNLSGSVASVNMDDIAEKRPITNLSSGLAGMAAGVSVTSSSNKPGEDNTSIMIRGQGTLNSSSPLVIIDGVESNINTVAPQDVESMTVLKDAASASIYGSRAANGVILITTKKGKSGKINIDYTGYAAIQSIGHTIDAVTNYADYMSLKNEAAKNSNRAGQYDPQMIEDWRADNGRNPLLYPNTDWVDEVFKSALATNHNLSLSGGSEKVTFYTSFGYNDNPGVMENSGYQRYSFRSNVEAKPLKWLTLGMKLGGYLSNREIGSGQLSNVFTYGSASTPGIVYRAPDGRYGGAQALGEDIQLDNPLVYLNSRDGNYKRRNFRSTFNGAITPLEGLTITGSYTYELTDDDNWEKPVYHDQWDFLHEQIVKHNTGRTWISNFNGKQERMFMDATIRYEDKVLNNRLSFSILAGASQELFRSYNMTAKKYDWTDESMDVINGFTGDAEASGSRSEWAMRSYFGRINLGWDDKYLVEVNLRADASSRFLKENRWGYFPSVSAGWMISEENFMKGASKWLSMLKLRASYGQTGNSNVGYRIYDYYEVGRNAIIGGAESTGVYASDLGNKSITWETTTEFNLGVDFGIFNNRFKLAAEYFKRKITDLLVTNKPLPFYNEVNKIAGNIGSTQSQGVEITLNTVNIVTKDFEWDTTLTLSHYNDRWLKRDPNWKPRAYEKEDDPIRAWWEYEAIGILQPGEKAPDAQKDLVPGMMKLKDRDGNGVLGDEDKVYMGNGDPKIIYGLNNSFRYKNFDLNIYFYGEAGRKRGASYYEGWTRMDNGINVSTYALKAFSSNNLTATDPTYVRGGNGWGDYYVKSIYYVRCGSITLGYKVPISQKIVNNLRVYVDVNNPFVITNWTGLDPETDNGTYAYPNVTSYNFGVSISF